MDMMKHYFSFVDYKACEYSFMTLYMWQEINNSHVMEKDDTMYIFGQDKKSMFSLVPISKTKRWVRDIQHLENIFNKYFNEKIEIRAAPKEYAEFMMKEYPGRFKLIEHRDAYDYLYDAESLRTLSGRKYHAKKNHYNKFIKEYADRFVYKNLTAPEEFEDAYDLMKRWAKSKDVIDETMNIEYKAVKKVLDNYSMHDGLKAAGIYIDGVMQAFTLADMLTDDTVCVHIEKANPNFNGIYAAINKIFLVNEYPDVKYANREDDLGLDYLRKAKLSYNPLELIEKYTLVEL